MTNPNTKPKSALILIEYQNDWLARTGSINPQFQDREQIDTAIANAAEVLAEARRRGMEVIHVAMVLEPTYRALGKAKYGLRAMIPAYGSFLGHQTDFFPGFEPAADEYVISERTGAAALLPPPPWTAIYVTTGSKTFM